MEIWSVYEIVLLRESNGARINGKTFDIRTMTMTNVLYDLGNVIVNVLHFIGDRKMYLTVAFVVIMFTNTSLQTQKRCLQKESINTTYLQNKHKRSPNQTQDISNS